MREHTHIAIANDVPSLSVREVVTCSGKTFDKLFLQTKRVSRELELPRQDIDVLLRLTKQTAPLSTLDHSLLKELR